MTVPELREKWAAIYDAPAPNTSRQNLELRLGDRIQELALGGLGRDARRTLDALATEVASGEPGQMVSDPRRPMPGTKLVREWNGVEHAVTVLAKGFEWQGRRYNSLSGAARSTRSLCGIRGSVTFLVETSSKSSGTTLRCVD